MQYVSIIRRAFIPPETGISWPGSSDTKHIVKIFSVMKSNFQCVTIMERCAVVTCMQHFCYFRR